MINYHKRWSKGELAQAMEISSSKLKTVLRDLRGDLHALIPSYNKDAQFLPPVAVQEVLINQGYIRRSDVENKSNSAQGDKLNT
ncbi:MAG: hypothetical protein AAFW00_19780 [Bacteroidota bacterium]